MLLLENHLSGAHASRYDEYLLHIPSLDQRQKGIDRMCYADDVCLELKAGVLLSCSSKKGLFRTYKIQHVFLKNFIAWAGQESLVSIRHIEHTNCVSQMV